MRPRTRLSLTLLMIVGCSGGTAAPPVESGPDAANVIDAADGGGGSSGSEDAMGAADSDGDVDDDERPCVAEFYEGKPLPVDLYILADSSVIADCPLGDWCPADGGSRPPGETRWSTVKDAIDSFASAPESTGIGLGFFPRLSGGGSAVSCLVDDYVVPDVPFGSTASSITNALGAQMPRGGWLLAAPLGGALRYAETRAKANPNRQAIVVIMTHGSDRNACSDDTFASAIAMAASAFASAPPVKTTVISLLPSFAELGRVAGAGGTWTNDVNPGSADARGETLARLRAASAPCDYPIPDTPDPSRTLRALFLEMRMGPLGAFSPIARFANSERCASDGWFYNDNSNPSRVALCPQTCRAITTTSGSAVRLGVGCPD